MTVISRKHVAVVNAPPVIHEGIVIVVGSCRIDTPNSNFVARGLLQRRTRAAYLFGQSTFDGPVGYIGEELLTCRVHARWIWNDGVHPLLILCALPLFDTVGHG